MTQTSLEIEQIAMLAVLADGIIPPDSIDAGASSVNAGQRLAEKIAGGWNTTLYLRGITESQLMARDSYNCSVEDLTAPQVHELLGKIRDLIPGFFKQLRLDVSALYLSDPAVWIRIGFPGPSTATGGYVDFNQPQTKN